MSALTSRRAQIRRGDRRKTKPLIVAAKKPAAPVKRSRFDVPAVPERPRRPDSKGNRKLDDMAAARQLGWKGHSYRKTKRFARKLERERSGGAS